MFVRGGYVYPGNILLNAGTGGNYWSSVGDNSNNAYNLIFYSGYVYPSGSNGQYFGLFVRCVALGG